MTEPMRADAIRRQLVAKGVPIALADRVAVEQGHAHTVVHSPSYTPACAAHFDRAGDVLSAIYGTPPRTKKNGLRWFGVQSVAYARFRANIVDATAPSLRDLALPLPVQAYNLRAVFYVDRPGERADIFGLLQGIADALQDAGVVTDDWQFRTVDGSHVVMGDDAPRVEVTISPTAD